MFRLLIAGALAYVTYRITRQMIDDVPDTIDPLLLPPSQYDREAVRRQSAEMGLDPQREGRDLPALGLRECILASTLRTKQKRCLMGDEHRRP